MENQRKYREPTGGASSRQQPTPARESETVWAHAMQWVSRTLAVALVMVVPGVLGAMLDKRLGTGFLAIVGFIVGILVGTTGLLVLARQFTPPARGKPLPWEEAQESDGSGSVGSDRSDGLGSVISDGSDRSDRSDE